MSRSWTLTDVEFAVLCETLDDGIVPYPLEYVSRTDDYAEYQDLVRAARARLPRILGHDLDEIRETLARPDIRVTAFGRDARDPENPESCLRLLGLRRDARGYLVNQLPGETLCYSGGFTIDECDPLHLGRMVAERLPPAEPGKRGRVPLTGGDGDEMDYGYGRSEAFDTPPGPAERAEAFLRSTVAHTGMIHVTQGQSLFGPRGRTGRTVVWRDHADDGRYAITVEPAPVAVPADAAQLTEMIDTAIIDIVAAIKDERVIRLRP